MSDDRFAGVEDLMSEPPNPTPVGDGLTYHERCRLIRVANDLCISWYMGERVPQLVIDELLGD